MDGFRSAGAVGILYAEDFSDSTRAAPPAPPDAPRAVTQADIDAACIKAVASAERAWLIGTAERRTETLAAIQAAIDGLRQDVIDHAEAVADGIARTALSALSEALPTLCQCHGDAEVQALLRHLLPLLARSTQLVVRLNPGLIDAVQADIAAFDENLASQISLHPSDLPPGDVRLHWENGSMIRDSAAIRAAIHDGLTRLGLLEPQPAPDAHLRSNPLGQ